MKICYKHGIHPTSYSHSCGHPQGCVLTKDGYIEVLQKLMSHYTDLKYYLYIKSFSQHTLIYLITISGYMFRSHGPSSGL